MWSGAVDQSAFPLVTAPAEADANAGIELEGCDLQGKIHERMGQDAAEGEGTDECEDLVGGAQVAASAPVDEELG